MSQRPFHPDLQQIARTPSIDARVARMRQAAGAGDDAPGSSFSSSTTTSSSRPSASHAALLAADVDRYDSKESTSSRRTAAVAAAAARGSRRGAQNWNSQLIAALLNAVEDVLPLGAYHWDEVVETFNKNTGREDDTARLKNKFMNLATARKPTGVNIKPAEIARAQQLHGKIEAKACMAEMGGDDGQGADEAADALSACDDGADDRQALDGMDDLDDFPPPQDSPEQPSNVNVSSSSTSSSSSASPASSSRHADGMLTDSPQSDGRPRPPARSFPSNRATPTKRPRSVPAAADLSTATETLTSSLAAVLADCSRQHRDAMLLYIQQMDRADQRAREDREQSATQFALLLAAITGKAHAPVP